MLKLDKQDSVFKALSDPKRREILDLLSIKPKTTGEICSHFKSLDRCTVMQHLKVLEHAGLLIVKSRTDSMELFRPCPHSGNL
ncbi:DNA-binding helix-turn-helix protein [Leptospira interrogans serovar Pyrogenes str. L0374]|uniref:DNA-binding helix-turn-helix protein n=1 Tax=Leptospira interrogans serovar Pyrogenes str. L0374 TaxID=1049928 RepID=M6KC98_LEPIR|nr:DNA-binding helix-turn-helix protein [Leptospira interrogans serovar Pyrogenes str. L0374]